MKICLLALLSLLLLFPAALGAQDFNQAFFKGRVVVAGACCEPLSHFTVIIDVQAPAAARGRHEVDCVGDSDPSFPLNFCFALLPGDCVELDGYVGSTNYCNIYNDRLFATSGFKYPPTSCW